MLCSVIFNWIITLGVTSYASCMEYLSFAYIFPNGTLWTRKSLFWTGYTKYSEDTENYAQDMKNIFYGYPA